MSDNNFVSDIVKAQIALAAADRLHDGERPSTAVIGGAKDVFLSYLVIVLCILAVWGFFKVIPLGLGLFIIFGFAIVYCIVYFIHWVVNQLG